MKALYRDKPDLLYLYIACVVSSIRPFLMVIVEIENGLYDIMYCLALESVEKEAKIS